VGPPQETSREMTGWDISGWDPVGKEGEEREAAEGKRRQAQECYQRGCRESPILDDGSTKEEVDRPFMASVGED